MSKLSTSTKPANLEEEAEMLLMLQGADSDTKTSTPDKSDYSIEDQATGMDLEEDNGASSVTVGLTLRAQKSNAPPIAPTAARVKQTDPSNAMVSALKASTVSTRTRRRAA
jgi:hypothetical protein